LIFFKYYYNYAVTIFGIVFNRLLLFLTPMCLEYFNTELRTALFKHSVLAALLFVCWHHISAVTHHFAFPFRLRNFPTSYHFAIVFRSFFTITLPYFYCADFSELYSVIKWKDIIMTILKQQYRIR
jgi:hypothetical protein